MTEILSSLVTSEFLVEKLAQNQNLRIVDARWRGDGTSSRELFKQGHIPGAVHLDWQLDFSWTDARGVRYLILPPPEFSNLMERVGIGDDTLVVAYADDDYSGAARLWWALRYYGHENVVVLDGGWNQWVARCLPVATGEEVRNFPSNVTFTARPQPQLIATQAEIKATISTIPNPDVALVDTRPPEQYQGRAVWTPPGSLFLAAGSPTVDIGGRGPMRAGHIPGAVNLQSTPTFLNQLDWTYLPPDEIRSKSEAVGLTPEKRIITYCGVGISASLGLFGLHLAGYKDLALYDASWEEWGTDYSCPIEKSQTEAGT